MKKDFEIAAEEGVIIYDESDDYDPGEDETLQTEGGFRLMTNEEIFTDEYMQNFAKEMDEEIAREDRYQRVISVGVVATVVLFIGAVTYFAFKNIL